MAPTFDASQMLSQFGAMGGLNTQMYDYSGLQQTAMGYNASPAAMYGGGGLPNMIAG